MIAVRLLDLDPNEALEISKELRLQGYNVGVDFDFANFVNRISVEGRERRYTNFIFYNEKLATWFALRYK